MSQVNRTLEFVCESLIRSIVTETIGFDLKLQNARFPLKLAFCAFMNSPTTLQNPTFLMGLTTF